MLIAVASVALIGGFCGVALGVAARRFHVEPDSMVAEIEALMPGSQCGQCGYPGCSGAAAAIASGEAPVTCCPPGGKALALVLAEKLGVTVDTSGMVDEGPKIAGVTEELCIGCTKCYKTCPTDAVIGAVKQVHAVIRDACTGCAKCEHACPTGAITLSPVAPTIQTWVWPKPQSQTTSRPAQPAGAAA
ncbi:RnfABCDGE type electron transport complex subunit B [Pseudothauera rhizosphaerae]|uniref:Ion-translocating oxidoreductase complex subunit B n=1 Tax=Pseudothauera rhizosphaerae TaxID=2565932 RepID=A0A4S4AR19_9RHOO|nr:RnfABCDGE type electron transport complex subunit B [Pseudothauera rhizosphaerae]THF62211.1 RnfABCDGE type electron transport complex subunit B [Pseudothauera rhizosphaerae]